MMSSKNNEFEGVRAVPSGTPDMATTIIRCDLFVYYCPQMPLWFSLQQTRMWHPSYLQLQQEKDITLAAIMHQQINKL